MKTLSAQVRALFLHAVSTYGQTSDIAIACQFGDVDAFMSATAHLGESDRRVNLMQNAVIVARMDTHLERTIVQPLEDIARHAERVREIRRGFIPQLLRRQAD